MPTADTCIVADEVLEMAAAAPVAMQASVDFSSAAAAARKSDMQNPCPRCESLDTKFCYFNNYNVNQPRYFCRRCQRYWTSGGSLRNLPVGAGRRKHKRPQTKWHEEIGTAFDDIMSFSGHTVVESNRSVPAETIASKESRLSHQNPSHYIHKHSLNHSQRHKDSIQKALEHEDEDSHQKVWPDSFKDDLTSRSSSSSADKTPSAAHSATASVIENTDNGNRQGFSMVSPPSMCPWSLPWPYPNVMAMSAGMIPAQADQVAAAAASFMWASATTAASFFQFHPMWSPVAWNAMANGNPANVATGNPASDAGNCLSNQPRRANDQTSLCTPKSLKIGDPDEVVHSSILTTLGLSSPRSPTTTSSTAPPPRASGFFNLNVMPKSDDTQRKSPATPLSEEERTKLQKMNQNPAAVARSLAFQEKN